MGSLTPRELDVIKKKKELPSVWQIGWQLRLPQRKWPGRCYEICCKILECHMLEGVARYGHYLGPVKEGTMFYDRLVVQHGWIEMKDGRIFDPTRWVFEGVEPYVYVNKNNGDYDIGGNKYRVSIMPKFPPVYNANGVIPIPLPKKPESFRTFAKAIFYGQDFISVEQLHWLATRPPDSLGKQAKPLFRWIKKIDQECLIPIDNWLYVMGGKRVG